LRIAFYNPPAPNPIIRRYMCSYNAGANLYPNIELLTLAADARAQGHTVAYIDCIAENLNTREGITQTRRWGAEMLVGICGLECFRDDVAELRALKAAFPEVSVGLCGYYPTLYPERCLQEGFDFVLLGEGEPGLEALLQGQLSSPGLATPGHINPPAARLSARQFKERRFYRAFYTSPAGIRTGLRTLLKDPRRALQATLEVLRFTVADKGGHSHPDYL